MVANKIDIRNDIEALQKAQCLQQVSRNEFQYQLKSTIISETLLFRNLSVLTKLEQRQTKSMPIITSNVRPKLVKIFKKFLTWLPKQPKYIGKESKILGCVTYYELALNEVPKNE